MHVRGLAPHPLDEAELPFTDVVRDLGRALPPFDTVSSGTFSSPGAVPRVRAFGPDHNVGVVVVPDPSGAIVSMMSLVLNGEERACADVVRAVRDLPSSTPLVIVDWRRGRILSP